MKSKNILIITKKNPYPSHDGESIVVWSDILALHSLGHRVYLLILNTRKHYQNIDLISNHEAIEAVKAVEIDTMSIKTIFKSMARDFNYWYLNRFWTQEAQSILEQMVVLYDIDCILYQGLPTLLYHKLSINTKAIYRAHNIEYRLWKRKGEKIAFTGLFAASKSIIYRLISRQLKRYESQIQMPVAALQDEETNYFLSNVSAHTVAITLPDNQWRWTYQASDKINLVIIGSMDWEPNIQGVNWFLDTVWTKYLDNQKYQLTIAGNNAKKAFRNISPQIQLIDKFSNIKDVLEGQHLLLIPLLSGAGIRIKALEALQIGIPTIATPIAIDGIYHDQSINIALHSIDFANQIKLMSQDLNSLNKRSIVMRKAYEAHYSMMKTTQDWIKMFEEL